MNLNEYLNSNKYVGRFILAGKAKNGENVLAYLISGRSENSRNRIFVKDDTRVYTKAFDESKMTDPTLIIYNAKRVLDDKIILTNGDQTDTIYDYLESGKSLSDALITREFENDPPIYTSRISSVMENDNYSLSILRKKDEKCERAIYNYKAKNGFAHVIHTYLEEDGEITPFTINPPQFAIPDTAEELADLIWNNTNQDNKISLYVMYADKEIILNKHDKNVINLKYGCNPNQGKASLSVKEGNLPLTVLNGSIGYINLLDALFSWQLVKELDEALDYPAAASFKHVSPAGAAIGLPLSANEKKMYFVKDADEPSALATAYIRARGSDRMCSFGDFLALSRECDEDTARVISREVSDGVIAPSYSDKALEILKKKKKGNYTILQMDKDYMPKGLEERDVFGLTFKQGRNNFKPDENTFKEIVSANTSLSEEAKRDLIVAMISLKYTQSNSVCYAKNGQTIGVGAGQQSRIHCTRLAGDKADNWNLRQSEKVLNLPFKASLTRNEKDNAIEQYLMREREIDVITNWENYFDSPVEDFSEEEKKEYLKTITDVSLSSDAFFPFRDNIDRAARSGVKYIAEPGGSTRDDLIIEAVNEYDAVLVFTHQRLFTH